MKYKSILIIHESKSKREILREFISAKFSRVIFREVETEREGEELIRHQHFDFVLSSLILRNAKWLSQIDTYVFILIPDESETYLSSIKRHGFQHYLVFPQNAADLHNKIDFNSNYPPRRHKRFNIPGTRVFIQLNDAAIEGSVQNLNEEGFLCELEGEGDYDQILEDIQATITFPRKFGKITIKNLNCSWLATHKDQVEGTKTRLQVVLLFSELTHEQLSVLRNVFQKLTTSQPHFFNHRKAALIPILLAIFLFFFFFDFSESKVKILWTNGQVFVKSSEKDIWEKSTENEYSSSYRFKIVSLNSDKKKQVDNFYVVLRYSPHETVILSKNGTFFRELSSSNHVGYQITGAAHIMLEGEPKTININGIELFTEGAHLFFHDLRQPAELKVVSGTMTMLPQQAVFLSKADQIEPQTGKIILTPEDIIKIKKSTFLLQKSEDKVKTLYNDTYLPGFTVDGEFRQVGYATIEEGTYTLERSEKDFKVAISTIPIMEHDTLKSGDKGKVLLKFYSDDHIRIYPQGKLSIVEFPLPEKYPILPLIIGVNAQQVVKTSLSRFRFKGKLRTKVNPKIKRRRFNLRSTQAMIAVKGTDFEASATEKAVEVLTLSGTVKLSDKDEKNAVIVSCGMMSQIQKGNLPEKPIPIPKDKLLELISDSLDKKEKLTLSSFNTADLNKLLLDSETPVSLFFNSNLSRANVILSGKAYPLEIINNSPELRLTQKTFADVKEEENAVQIEVTDVHGRTALFKANLKLQPHVKPTKQKTVFDNKIHFDQGKSVLNPDSYKLLNEIVELIKSNPKITGISIVGHADCDGSPDDNLRLSIKRAEAVRQYLIKNGIPGTILFSRGYGDKKPIADNSSVSGMKKNRRVEFIITQH